jgi:putative hemolysin
MTELTDHLAFEPASGATPEPLAPPADCGALASEVRQLPASAVLARSGALVSFLAGADAIPHLLYEIGRLRELTFRAIGEGTGKRMDLDWFDSHYLHLVLWNEQRSEVVGAYRCGATDAIVPRLGVDGLYTATLFAYENTLIARLVPGLELGRSFVRPEYQKTYSALFLLWRGIGEFVARNPRYKLLFGTVSVSNDFRGETQRRIVEFLDEVSSLPALARFVKSRSPLGPSFASRRPRVAPPYDLGALDREVRELEHGERSLPALLKQYLKLGGRVLGFARDPDFRDSLDALILVDLSAAPPEALTRYMRDEGFRAFLEYHRPSHTRRDDCWPSR